MSQTPALKPVLEIVMDQYGDKLMNYDATVYEDLQELMESDNDSIVKEFHDFMNQHGEEIDFWHPIASEVLYELSRNIPVEAKNLF